MPTPDIHTNFLGGLYSALAVAASFLFDQTLGVVVATAAGAYYAAYRSSPNKMWKYVAMIAAGIFLGTMSVKGVNWVVSLPSIKWPEPPGQIVGMIFGYAWIYEPMRKWVLNLIKEKAKAFAALAWGAKP